MMTAIQISVIHHILFILKLCFLSKRMLIMGVLTKNHRISLSK